MKSSRSEVSKWVNTNFQWQSFLWWSEKTGRRRKDFYQKKKGDSKHDLVKNVVFENTGEYVKGERKGRKSIIKSKRIFKKKKRDTFKKDNKKKRNMGKTDVQSRKRSKKENVQKTQEKTHKKGKIEKKDREKDEHAKTYKFGKMSNKKVKSFR